MGKDLLKVGSMTMTHGNFINTRYCEKHGYYYYVLPGTKCGKCSGQVVSKGEAEVLSHVYSYYRGEIISGDKDILNGKELDIFLPDINLAIEFNGLKYHGEDYGIGGNRDKFLMCKKRGIKLLTVTDYMWYSHKGKVKNFILRSLNNQECIDAQSLLVESINDYAKIKDFYLKNAMEYIRGMSGHQEHLAIIKDHEIICMISREGTKIKGYASSLDFKIENGMRKLIRALPADKYSIFINNDYGDDIDIFTRYSMHENITKPRFKWYKGNKTLMVTKRILRKMDKDYCGESVNQYMRDKGWKKTYDTGSTYLEFIGG